MVDFVIDHLDPLGQGVSKRVSQSKQNPAKKQSTITFIPKTLPGEQGSAKIIKSSKGVEFGELLTLSKTSAQRIQPECVHFAQCSGCDYLHLSYRDELAYKKAALLFLLRGFILNGKNLSEDDIELIPAPQRFGYRNRVQLHYRHKYIGLVDANSDRILEVPNCRLLREELKPVFNNLYADKNWSTVHKGAEGKNKDGHCEISLRKGEVSIEWDAPYASGGFTQVNEQMNIQLRQWLQERFTAEKISTVLDLFAGDGNLSDVLLASGDIKRVMVDSCGEQALNTNPAFIKQDLFADDALDRFMHRTKLKKVDLLLLDPPRKGFPALTEWFKRFKPEYLAYVSCNPATLARDLQALLQSNKQLKICNVVLLDMFPGTRHFETIVVAKA